MQQRVTIGPLRDGERIAGAIDRDRGRHRAARARTRRWPAALESADAAVRRARGRGDRSGEPYRSARRVPPVLGDDDWRMRYAAVRGPGADGGRRLACGALIDDPAARTSQLQSAEQRPQAAGDDRRRRDRAARGAPRRPGCRPADPGRAGARRAAPSRRRSRRSSRALADPDVNVRFHAIEALGRLRAEAAIERLLAIVESRDFFLAFAALDALAAHRRSAASRPISCRCSTTINLACRSPTPSARSATTDRSSRWSHALNRSRRCCGRHRRRDRPAIARSAMTRRTETAIDVARSGPRCARRPPAAAHADRRGRDCLRRATAGSRRGVLGWLRGPEVGAAALTRLLGRRRRARRRRRSARPPRRAAVVDCWSSSSTPRIDGDASRGDCRPRPARQPARDGAAARGSLDGSPRRCVIAAAGALARIGDPARLRAAATAPRRTPMPRCGRPSIGALNSIGHPEMPARIGALLDERRSARPRVGGADCRLLRVSRDRRPAPRAGRRDPIESVRAAALEHLPFFDDDRAAVACFGGRSTRDTPRVRAAAARALGRVEIRRRSTPLRRGARRRRLMGAVLRRARARRAA